MPNDILVTEKPVTIEEAQASGDLVEIRETSDEMSMGEFAQWLMKSFGSLTLEKALQQAAFMLCCDVIAQDLAKSPLRLRQRLPGNTSRVVEPGEHPVADFLALEPNRRHTWSEAVEMMALWQCFTMNSFAVVFRDARGVPTDLIPIPSSNVRERVIDRDVFYDIGAATQQQQALLGATSLTVHERDVIHVRGRMIDGMDGYSTMLAGRQTLESGAALEAYRQRVFTDDGQIRGVFIKDGADPLPELAFNRLRSQMGALMRRVQRNLDPIVLEGGIKFEKIAVNPDDAELTKQFEAQINATCRLLRVPPHKVFLTSDTKYDNLETQDKLYVGDTLIPVATRFEHRYGKVLLSRKDRLQLFFEHDRDEMAIKDTKVQTDRIIRATERGVLTIDEARAALGYNPLANGAGEIRMVPTNMTMVDENNQVVVAGASTAQGDQPPADEGKAKA